MQLDLSVLVDLLHNPVTFFKRSRGVDCKVPEVGLLERRRLIAMLPASIVAAQPLRLYSKIDHGILKQSTGSVCIRVLLARYGHNLAISLLLVKKSTWQNSKIMAKMWTENSFETLPKLFGTIPTAVPIFFA